MGHSLTRNLLLIIGARDTISGPLRKVQSAFRSLQGVSGAAIKGISLALAGATTAVIAFGKASLDAFASFDTSMRNTWTLLDIGQQEITALGDSILQMTSRVPQTPEQLGSAVYDILSSGIENTGDALLVLEQSAMAAVAGLTTTKNAAGGAVAIMNAFGKSTGEVPEIFDLMFSAVKIGVLTFEQLTPVVGQTASAFVGAGASLEDMLGGLAFLTRTGLDAAEAGTQLRAAMFSLTKEAPNLKKELGVAVFDAQGGFRGLDAIIGDLNQSLAGLTKEAQLKKIQELVPERRALSALIAMSGGYKELSGILKDVASSQGAMASAAEKQLGSWTNQVQFMKNAFTAIKTAIGEVVAAVVGPELAKFTKWLQEVSGGLIENKAGMKAFVMAIVPVLKTVAGDIVNVLKMSLEIAWGFVQSFFTKFQESPRLLLIVLGGLFYEIPGLMWTALQSALDVVDAVAQVIFTPLEGALVWIGDKIRDLYENNLRGKIVDFLNWLISKANWVREKIGLEPWELLDKPEATAGAMTFDQAWKDTFEVLRLRFKDLGSVGKTAVVSLVQDAVARLKELAGTLKGELVTPDLQAKIDALNSSLLGIPAALEQGFDQAGKAAEDAATKAKTAAEQVTAATTGAAPKPGTVPGKGTEGAAEEAGETFGQTFGKAFAASLGLAGGNAVASLIGLMFEAINDGDIGGFVDKFADGAVKFILALARGIPTFILKIIERIPDIILALVEAIPVFIGEFIRMLPEILKAFADGLGKIFKGVAKLLALGFLVLVEKLIGGLLRFLGLELRDDIAMLQGEVNELFAEATTPRAAQEPSAATAGTAQDFARTTEAGAQTAPVVVYNIDFSQPFVMADQTSMDQLARLLAEAEYRQARRSRGSTGT